MSGAQTPTAAALRMGKGAPADAHLLYSTEHYCLICALIYTYTRFHFYLRIYLHIHLNINLHVFLRVHVNIYLHIHPFALS